MGPKQQAERSFLDALALLDGESREPDAWEQRCLAYALTAMACGMYFVAHIELRAFARPVAERPADVIAHLKFKSLRFTRANFRQLFQSVDKPAAIQAGPNAGPNTYELADHLPERWRQFQLSFSLIPQPLETKRTSLQTT